MTTEVIISVQHNNDCNKVVILEDGNVARSYYYHRDVPDDRMIVDSVKDWIGDEEEENFIY